MTQAELARALEISPVTLNRWENDDRRYRPSDKDIRLLEALEEVVDAIGSDSGMGEMRDVLRVSTVAGVVGKAAVERLLKVSTITLLAATPGLGWLGLMADVGVGAALPFPSRAGAHAQAVKAGESGRIEAVVKRAVKPVRKGPMGSSRGSRERWTEAPESPSLYSLSVESL